MISLLQKKFVILLSVLTFVLGKHSDQSITDDQPAWYFAEWTIPPTPYPTHSAQFDGVVNTYPTPYPTNRYGGIPRPSPSLVATEWETEHPTIHPTPTIMDPVNIGHPTIFPTPYPTPYPTAWPTPVIGTFVSKSCDDITETTQVYPSHFQTFGYQGISVQYYNQYKIVSVYDHNDQPTTYILYMCEAPDQRVIDELGHIHANKYIKIPLKRAGFASSNIVHIFELLSLQPALRAAAIPLDWLSSPCLHTLSDNGFLVQAYNWDTQTYDNEVLYHHVDATFYIDKSTSENNEHENGSPYHEIYNGISIPEQFYNSTALDTAIQMIGFFSLFFNQEKQANQLITNLKNNYKCSSKSARRNANPVSAKKVLWCDYGGKARIQGIDHNQKNQIFAEDIWSCKSCPGIECGLVRDAGGKLLDYKEFGEHTITVNGKEYLESTEFMEMAVFADVWINPSTDGSDFNDTVNLLFEEIYTDMPNGWLPLTEIPAIKQRRVYDFFKRGFYAANQEMLAEPDALLQDIYSVIAGTNHDRVWLRNVFNEHIGMSTTGTCDGSPWVTVATMSQDCNELGGSPFPTREPAAAPTTQRPSPTTLRKSTLNSIQNHANTHRHLIRKFVIAVLGMVVGIVIVWYAYKTISSTGAKGNELNVAASQALGSEGRRMDTAINPVARTSTFQRYSPTSSDPYISAAQESEHGVLSSEHGGVISSGITPVSGILGVPGPTTRTPPIDIDEEIRLGFPSRSNRGLWGLLFPFIPDRNSYT